MSVHADNTRCDVSVVQNYWTAQQESNVGDDVDEAERTCEDALQTSTYHGNALATRLWHAFMT